MKKQAGKTEFYTPTSPTDAASWYTSEKRKKRTVFWDGVDNRMVSTSESDLRKIGVKDLSKLARVYSEANIMRQLKSLWTPTPSAMGSSGVISYKGKMYAPMREVTASTPLWYKSRLVKAMKKIPRKFVKGVPFRVVKGHKSFTSPSSPIINISEEDFWHRGKDCEAMKKKIPSGEPYICGGTCPFGLEKLGKVDFGVEHAANVIAHELGHHYWNHKMTSAMREKFAPRITKISVKTKTGAVWPSSQPAARSVAIVGRQPAACS